MKQIRVAALCMLAVLLLASATSTGARPLRVLAQASWKDPGNSMVLPDVDGHNDFLAAMTRASASLEKVKNYNHPEKNPKKEKYNSPQGNSNSSNKA